MKKALFLVCVLLSALTSYAQNQGIRLPERPDTKNFRNYSAEDAGFWFAIEGSGGTTVRFNRTNAIPVEATFTGGYRFNEYFRIGLGVGAKYFCNNSKFRTDNVAVSFPVFADLRGNIISQEYRNAVPFWAVDLGAEFRGGLYFSPTVGYRFGLPRSSFLLGLSYEFMQTDTWKKEAEGIGAVRLKIGYEF